MTTASWLDELVELLAATSGMGMTHDANDMSICELWGLYCFLKQRADSEHI